MASSRSGHGHPFVRRLVLLAGTLAPALAPCAAASCASTDPDGSDCTGDRCDALDDLIACKADPEAGNAWHIPQGSEPGIPTMRAPVLGGLEQDPIALFSGNQAKGTGKASNQLQKGSSLLFRTATEDTFRELPLTFFSEKDNNKYFRAQIPADLLESGDTIEYYFRIAYSDRATTFVFGNDHGSCATTDEAAARREAFVVTVSWPLQPPADSEIESLVASPLEGRVYVDSGHVSVVGPTLVDGPAQGDTGAPQEIVIAPPAAKIRGRWFAVGRIKSASPGKDGGLELVQELGRNQVTAELRLASDGVVRYEVTDWGAAGLPSEIALSSPTATGERFYGLGERFDSLDQTGKLVSVLTRDPPGDKGGDSYMVTPWFVSTRGYGFQLDSTVESAFDMAATQADRTVARALFPSLPGAGGAIVPGVRPGTSRLAFHIVYGPELRSVLSRYTALTGRPRLPPAFTFGPWLSTDHWRDGGEVRYAADKYVQLGIPGSVFVFDSPWETAYNDFQWNMAQFSKSGTYEGKTFDGFESPRAMMDFLRQRGFKVMLWLTPLVNVSSNDEKVPGQNTGKAGNYDDGVQRSVFVKGRDGKPLVAEWWKGRGSHVDFTRTEARKWLQDQLRALVEEAGGAIGGFKIDDGEALDPNGQEYIPLDAMFADGRRGVEMQNAYTLEYHRTVNEVLSDAGVLFARSGFTGTQSFPACWAGDNEPNFGVGNGLPSAVRAMLSAAMSGYSTLAHDIGGYQDTNPSTTEDYLFMRWTQVGAMSPIMQLHRQVIREKQYPWRYSTQALDNYKKWAGLHTSLFPYIFTYATEAAETGVPLMRPLVLIHQDDVNTHAMDDEYYFGPDLLVAPILHNDDVKVGKPAARQVYLPEGTWIDWFSRERFSGRQRIQWESGDLTRLPVFVRAGAILPMMAPGVQTLNDDGYVGAGAPVTTTIDDLQRAVELEVYPDGQSSQTVFDGTRLDVDQQSTSLALTLTSAARAVTLRVLAATEPTAVRVGAATLTRFASQAALEAAPQGWAFEGDFVHIKLAHGGGTAAIQL